MVKWGEGGYLVGDRCWVGGGVTKVVSIVLGEERTDVNNAVAE